MATIQLDQAYSGPRIIKGFLNKRKDSKSFGILIGTFNMRYFTLDLSSMTFYYAKNEQSTKNIKYFPIEDIKAVRASIYKYNGNAMWNYPFTIRTSKRVYLMIARDNTFYNTLMNAFKHMFNIATGEYLYDASLDLPEEAENTEKPSKIMQPQLQQPQSQQKLASDKKPTQSGTRVEETEKVVSTMSKIKQSEQPKQVVYSEGLEVIQPKRIDLAKTDTAKPNTQNGNKYIQEQKALIYDDEIPESKEQAQYIEKRPPKQQKIIEVDIEQLDDVKGGNTVHDPKSTTNKANSYSGSIGTFRKLSVVNLGKDKLVVSSNSSNTQGKQLFESISNSRINTERNLPQKKYCLLQEQRWQGDIRPKTETENTSTGEIIRRKKKQNVEEEGDGELDFLKSKLNEADKKQLRRPIENDSPDKYYHRKFNNLGSDSKVVKQTEYNFKYDDDNGWGAKEPDNSKGRNYAPVNTERSWQPSHKNGGWDDEPLGKDSRGGKSIGRRLDGLRIEDSSTKKSGLMLSEWDEPENSNWKNEQPNTSPKTSTETHVKRKIEINKKEMYEDWDDDL